MARTDLPVPPHHDPETVGEVWRVDYEQRARDAERWAAEHAIPPAARDVRRIALLATDVQNTFCMPGHALFVAGRSGTAAVEDCRRLCSFVYRNLGALTRIHASLDTHTAMQVFHAVHLVDADGNHPPPLTQVSVADVENGRWRFNPEVAATLDTDPAAGQEHLLHYVRSLSSSGKYELTVWPYHAMLGGIGHALVPAFEEAVFFHGIARRSQADFRIKGKNPWTEHYSILGPEVTTDARGHEIADKDDELVETLLGYDAVVVAGQAKSHCVAWTISDLLEEIRKRDEALAGKVYLLEDCTSPVVVPDQADFTEQADAAFERFATAGMHRVRSTDPLETWPQMPSPRERRAGAGNEDRKA